MTGKGPPKNHDFLCLSIFSIEMLHILKRPMSPSPLHPLARAPARAPARHLLWPLSHPLISVLPPPRALHLQLCPLFSHRPPPFPPSLLLLPSPSFLQRLSPLKNSAAVPEIPVKNKIEKSVNGNRKEVIKMSTPFNASEEGGGGGGGRGGGGGGGRGGGSGVIGVGSVLPMCLGFRV
jgi:uncharacterized membrane protein YgcG